METPVNQFFVCAGLRAASDVKGVCHKKGAVDLIPYLEEELRDRDMDDSLLTITGCLNHCEQGPVMIVQPGNHWYTGVDSEEAIDAILDAMESGSPAEEYLLNKS